MKKILVAYFSASGETAKLAKTIAGVEMCIRDRAASE